jgi:hypothetical protein
MMTFPTKWKVINFMVPTKQIIRWNREDPTCRHSNHQKGDKKNIKSKASYQKQWSTTLSFCWSLFCWQAISGKCWDPADVPSVQSDG